MAMGESGSLESWLTQVFITLEMTPLVCMDVALLGDFGCTCKNIRGYKVRILSYSFFKLVSLTEKSNKHIRRRNIRLFIPRAGRYFDKLLISQYDHSYNPSTAETSAFLQK